MRISTSHSIAYKLALAGTSLALAASCALVPADNAHAVTAAEKRAEADEVFAQIDSLQTSLNKVVDEHNRAQAAYEDAIAKRDEASAKIEAETKHIEQLQGELSEFAVGMYKQGGTSSFLDVLLDATSFEQFVTTWDACSAISNLGTNMIDEAQQARDDLEEAKATFEKQGERAEAKMAEADSAQAEIEDMQAALRTEAEKLSQEADELQREEEAAAEAARQAEEARKQREAELAAAAEAAAKSEQQAQEQAADDNSGDIDSDDESGGSDALVMGTGYFTHPLPGGTISSGFGYRTFDYSFHKGVDLAAPEGTPYYAADSGTVMYATNDGGYNGGAGNWVVISHGNGVVTKYMHSSATYVRPGDQVERGENIGAVGNTGNSFGAHLHFQVEVGGVAVNPLNYI